jgi:hypothetical protein
MKTTIKSILAIALNVMVLFSCKKADQIEPIDQQQLVNNQEFRNFVANDMFLIIQNTLQNASSLNKKQTLQFKEALKSVNEADLLAVFAEHNLSYSAFQEFHLKRHINQVKILHALPEISKLPENEINQLFKSAYESISNKVINQIVRESSMNKPAKMSKTLNTPKSSSINTHSLNGDFMYFSSEDEQPMSEEAAFELMNELVQSYAQAHDIEAMNCLKQAVGWGAGSMIGIVGWSKGIAGLAIQEAVVVATRFAMRYIGWIGLAVTTYTLTSCLIEAY